jgi:CDGSH-type Zn-finger protein
MSGEAIVAQKAPYGVDVVEGKTYWWCSCGRSKKQPYCDGSHKVTSLTPMEYKCEKSGKVWFCGCKQTGKSPMCDGSHNKI